MCCVRCLRTSAHSTWHILNDHNCPIDLELEPKTMNTHPTYGLTHLAILVKDVRKTLRFYKDVFCVDVMYQEDTWAQVRTPGSNDILVFEQSTKPDVGTTGGILHFGFRLREPGHISEMIRRVNEAGGEILTQGEFVPGSPYVFFKDPDGYEIEIWYEMLPA
jgi:catechol 2,3-dioxygenase-like lactoylglutathione lyase family enzyme